MASSGMSLITYEEYQRYWKAMSTGDIDNLRKLLKSHPDLVDEIDYKTGYAAIHWAVHQGRVDIMNLVVGRFNGSLETRCTGGLTALHLAVIHNRPQLYYLLRDIYKANENAADRCGLTPVDYARQNELYDGKEPTLPEWVHTLALVPETDDESREKILLTVDAADSDDENPYPDSHILKLGPEVAYRYPNNNALKRLARQIERSRANLRLAGHHLPGHAHAHAHAHGHGHGHAHGHNLFLVP